MCAVQRVPRSGDTLAPVLGDHSRVLPCWGYKGREVKEVGARTQILSLAHFTGVVQKPGKFPTIAGPFPCLHMLYDFVCSHGMTDCWVL